MGTYLTLSPCASNGDGTYRDLYWVNSDETAQTDRLWFELNMSYIRDLTCYYSKDATHFDIEESVWFCAGGQFADFDLDKIPAELLFSPSEVKRDLLRWKQDVEKYDRCLSFYYQILIYKFPDYVSEEVYSIITLQDGEFFEYDCSHGGLSCCALEPVQSSESGSTYLSATVLQEKVCVEKFIMAYSAGRRSYEVEALRKKEEQGAGKDILSITRRTAYEYFLPYAEHMISVCDKAIENDQMLIAGTF